MKIVFWVLQILLALHTLIGALWKFSTTAEQTMPSLASIPHPVWLAMSGIEILCAIALILPALKPSFRKLGALGAIVIAIEMLAFCAIHVASGNGSNLGPMIYWIVVAVLAGIIAAKRAGNSTKVVANTKGA